MISALRLFFVLVMTQIFIGGNAQNITRVNIPGPMDIQVNSFTGNLYYKRTDLRMAGREMPIVASFTYNSQLRNRNLGFGYGWNFIYGIRYRQIGSSTTDSLVVQWSDGREELYTRLSSIYEAPLGVFNGLERLPNGGIRIAQKDGFILWFEDSTHKRLTRLEEPSGNQTIIDYSNGFPTKITNDVGLSIDLSWSSGRLIRLTDNISNPVRTVNYSYDSQENLTEVEDPLSNVMSYSYGPDHELVGIVDRNGNPVEIAYQNQNAVTEIISCLGTQSFRYDESEGRFFLIDNQNRAFEISYNESGVPNQVELDGIQKVLLFDSALNLSRIVNGLGDSLVLKHDPKGNLTYLMDYEGNEVRISYEPTFNDIRSYTNQNGDSTLFTYDIAGNLVQIDYPLGIMETFTYNSNGELITTADGNNNENSFSYNSIGQLSELQYELGTQSFRYDTRGNLTTYVDADSDSLTFEFDPLDRLTRVYDANGDEYQFEYDANGNRTKEIEPNGNFMSFGYDALDRLIETKESTGRSTYEYDEAGNLTKMFNPRGFATSYTYNDRNLVIAEEDASGRRRTYGYDANDNLVRFVDADGEETTFSYDKEDRILSRTNQGKTDTYEYDAIGNLTRAFNQHIEYAFEYDALNRLTRKDIITWGKSIHYTYDKVGNRISLTDPDGILTLYKYDKDDRLTHIIRGLDTTRFHLSPQGKIIAKYHPNGTYSKFTYEPGGRLDSIIHYDPADSILLCLAYDYDKNGNRTHVISNSISKIYQYDSVNRVTQVTENGVLSEGFEYDAFGNRKVYRSAKDSIQYQYDPTDQINLISNGQVLYDARGNSTHILRDSINLSLTYDGLNRITQIQSLSGQARNYRYGPFGEKIMESDENGITHRLIYDGENLLVEQDTNGVTTRKYKAGLVYDSWLDLEINGQLFSYHRDAIGSTMIMTDSNGVVVQRYAYHSYGDSKLDSGNLQNRFKYAGRSQEITQGIYYNRARFYDSGLGRFLSLDEYRGDILVPHSQNRYIYGEANPLSNFDPTGKFIFPVIKIVAAVAGALYAIDKLSDAKESAEKIKNNRNNFQDIIEELNSGKFDRLNELNDATKAVTDDFVNEAKGQYSELAPLAPIPVRGSGPIGAGFKVLDYLEDLWDDFFEEEPNEYLEDKDPEEGQGPSSGQGFQEETQSNSSTPEEEFEVPILNSFDPNEIVAPDGFGPESWVPKDALLTYQILFENDPDSATAAAQQVKIDLDWEDSWDIQSFKVGDYGFGYFNFEVGDELTAIDTRLDVRDSLELFVDLNSAVEPDSQRFIWFFSSIDTLTGLETLDPFAGFLPVNDSNRIGEGYVYFSIKPSSNAQTFDKIEPKAEIFFDLNPPIATPMVSNTIDADTPQSQIVSIAALDTSTLEIKWQGQDLGSGIANFDIYVSENNGLPIQWKSATKDTVGIFNANLNSTYCFQIIATDNVGYREAFTDNCDVNFTFTPDLFDFSISGAALSPLGDTIPSVNFSLQDLDTTQSIINQNKFQFTGGISSRSIAASKDNDQDRFNGVDVSDIMRSTRHILGIDPFGSAYEYIAADASPDGIINSADLLLTQYFILQAVGGFPQVNDPDRLNRLWTFIPQSQVFSSPGQFFPYDTAITLNQFANIADQNFVGIKLGDVNYSWNPNILRTATDSAIMFTSPEIYAEVHDTITIPIRVSNFHKVGGYQFTLSWDTKKLNFLDAKSRTLIHQLGNTQVEDGHLTLLWTDPMALGENLLDSTEVLTISFIVLDNLEQSALLSIGSELTRAIGYSADFYPLEIIDRLGRISAFRDNEQPSLFVKPNPFSEKIEIGFSLSQESDVEIKIFNQVGQLIIEHQQDYNSGKHSWIWDSTDNVGNPKIGRGIYLVSVKTNEQHKMIKVIKN